jgi:RNase P/RNase MRP subunit p29
MSKETSNTRKSRVWRILSSSLVGLEIEIVESSSEDLIGLKGVIEEETANLLRILTEKKILSVPKLNQVFKIITSDETTLLVEGHMIKGTPETRVRKKIPNW